MKMIVFILIYQDKRKKKIPKYKLNDLVRTAYKRNIISKFDSINWSYNLYKITENIDYTTPSYRINNLPERYNEALLQKQNSLFLKIIK